MVKARADDLTLDLLAWKPRIPEIAFEKRETRGATIEIETAKAVSVALRDCDMSRADVAAKMTVILQEEITETNLNNWASVARDQHRISHSRMIALAEATGDLRLLSIGADHLDCMVVPRSYKRLIEAAMKAEKIRQLTDSLNADRQDLKEAGVFE